MRLTNSNGFFAKINPVNKFKAVLYDIINSPNGEVKALGIICIGGACSPLF